MASKKTFSETIIEQKRQQKIDNEQRYHNLMNVVSQGFEQLGVSSIKIGNENINLNNNQKATTSDETDEEFFTKEIENKKELFLVYVSNEGHGYLHCEKANPEKLPLDDLIDEDVVKQFAPSCKIYAPKDASPWSEFITNGTFKIFTSNRQEAIALQMNMPLWFKTQWHDNILAKYKSNFQAKDVFDLSIYHIYDKNLSQKIQDYQNTLEQFKQMENDGALSWSSYSQTEFKKILNSLVKLEEHPVYSNEIQLMTKTVSQMLDKTAQDKKTFISLEKLVEKKRCNIYSNIDSYCNKFTEYNIPFNFKKV